MTQYSHIVFMQDSEGHDVIDRMDTESPEEIVDYLAQWDYGDDYDVRDTPSAGEWDDTMVVGEYLLTWNSRLGYVGLERIIGD